MGRYIPSVITTAKIGFSRPPADFPGKIRPKISFKVSPSVIHLSIYWILRDTLYGNVVACFKIYLLPGDKIGGQALG